MKRKEHYQSSKVKKLNQKQQDLLVGENGFYNPVELNLIKTLNKKVNVMKNWISKNIRCFTSVS